MKVGSAEVPKPVDVLEIFSLMSDLQKDAFIQIVLLVSKSNKASTNFSNVQEAEHDFIEMIKKKCD